MNMVPGPQDIETYRVMHEPIYFQGCRLMFDPPGREPTVEEMNGMALRLAAMLDAKGLRD